MMKQNQVSATHRCSFTRPLNFQASKLKASPAFLRKEYGHTMSKSLSSVGIWKSCRGPGIYDLFTAYRRWHRACCAFRRVCRLCQDTRKHSVHTGWTSHKRHIREATHQQNIFSNSAIARLTPTSLRDAAILTPLNKDIDKLNRLVTAMLQLTHQLSFTVTTQFQIVSRAAAHFPTEVLHSFDLPGPPKNYNSWVLSLPQRTAFSLWCLRDASFWSGLPSRWL